MSSMMQPEQHIEQDIISYCLRYGAEAATILSHCPPDDFFYLPNIAIARAMLNIITDNRALNIVSVGAALGAMDFNAAETWADVISQKQGDITIYLHALQKNGDHAHMPDKLFIVQQAAVRRRLASAGDVITKLAQRHDLSINAILTESHTQLETAERGQLQTAAPLGALVAKLFDAIERASDNDDLTRIFTGIPELDNPRMIGGINKGALVIVGAATGMGKTSFMTSLALRMQPRHAGLFMSMEMTADEMAKRFTAIGANIPLRKLRAYSREDIQNLPLDARVDAEMTTAETKRLVAYVPEFSGIPIVVKYVPILTPADVWSEVRRIKSTLPIDYVIVDLISNMKLTIDCELQRDLELRQIAQKLKDMAVAENIVVFATAQVSSSVEQRNDKRPGVNEFEYSKAIGRIADMQWMLYRDGYYDTESINADVAEILLRKVRDGQTGGIVRLRFNGEYGRWYSPHVEPTSVQLKLNK